MIAALAGGIGGSKLLLGLASRIPPEQLTIIGNTGDDIELFGLRICPDLDTITYTLAGQSNPQTGWGLLDETFRCLKEMQRLGCETWFQLGDRDLATQIFRTRQLGLEVPLSEVTLQICCAWGVRQRLLPMCEDYAPTYLSTDQGRLHFQEYLVRENARPVVQQVDLGAAKATNPGGGVAAALRQANAVIICPSNPLISIGPILAVRGIAQVLKEASTPVIAVSPIVHGASLKGPSAKMMRELGHEVSALGVARIYRGLVNTFILDSSDHGLASAVESLGMQAWCADTIMQSTDDKLRLADFILERL